MVVDLSQFMIKHAKPKSGRLALESDVQDGKLFREREKVIYARLGDVGILQQAQSADSQKQWQVKIEKSDDNLAKGTIRVREIIELVKQDDSFSAPNGAKPQYVLTAKAEKSPEDRLEVPVPVTVDFFNLFKQVATNGMIKHRFHFPVDGSEIVFEVDAFFKEDGSYHEWVKIDIELKDISVEVPELPFEVEEQIQGDTEDETEKSKISELYETIFLTKNLQQDSVAQEGVVDWVKDKFSYTLSKEKVESVKKVFYSLDKFNEVEKLKSISHGAALEVPKFFFRIGRIAGDLSQSINVDLKNLAVLNDVYGNLNQVFSKIDYEDSDDDILRKLEGLSSNPYRKLDNLHWLGDVSVKIKVDKINSKSDQTFNSSLRAPRLLIELLSFAHFGFFTYYFDNKVYKRNIAALNKLIETQDLEAMKTSVNGFKKEFEAMAANLVYLSGSFNYLKGHSSSELRQALRFGQNAAKIGTLISDSYGTFFGYQVK